MEGATAGANTLVAEANEDDDDDDDDDNENSSGKC